MQGRFTHAEVVQPEPVSFTFQSRDGIPDEVAVVHGGFRDLELDQILRKTVRSENPVDFLRHVCHPEVCSGEIDGDEQVVRDERPVLLKGFTDLFQHIQVKPIGLSLCFESGDEVGGRNQALFRVGPTRQRLKAAGFPAQRPDERLVEGNDQAFFQRFIQMIPDKGIPFLSFLRTGVVQTDAIPSGGLRFGAAACILRVVECRHEAGLVISGRAAEDAGPELNDAGRDQFCDLALNGGEERFELCLRERGEKDEVIAVRVREIFTREALQKLVRHPLKDPAAFPVSEPLVQLRETAEIQKDDGPLFFRMRLKPRFQRTECGQRFQCGGGAAGGFPVHLHPAARDTLTVRMIFDLIEPGIGDLDAAPQIRFAEREAAAVPDAHSDPDFRSALC